MKRLLFLPLLCWCLLIMAASQPFTFGLLTDIHISKSNPTPLEDLNNSVSELNQNPDIAFVIVSGDVTESGDSLSMVAVKAVLDRLQVPYYITSGNHETKWSESGCKDFADVFGSDRFCFLYNDCCFIGFNSGPVIKMADGHVAPQDITWVREQLDKLPEGTPVFPVTHYPLQTGDVDNWYDVTNMLRRYNVQAVLGGHYHRNLLFNCDGIPDVLHRSNLRANQPVGGYSVLSVAADSIRFSEKVIGEPARQWLALPFGQHDYGEPDSALLPDFSVNEQYHMVHRKWQTALEVGIYAAPAVDGNTVYLGDDEGKFYALSLADGSVQWTYQTGSRIVSTACVADGKVVFGSTDGNICCLNQADGKLLWKVTTGKAVMGCPVVNKGIVYIGGSDGCFRALYLKNGKQKWVFDQVEGYIESRPCLYEGNIYFGAWGTYLYALRQSDGSLLWKWNNGSKNDKFSPAAVWPVASDGKIFITAPDRYFTALDAQTGEVVWRTKEHVVRETVGISTDGKMIFSRCMNDYVVAMDATADTPVTLWNHNAQYGYDHNPSMLMEKDGVIVFGTKNGLLHGIDAATGKVVWRHKIGNSVLNTVYQLSGDACVVSSSDGTVTYIEVR